MLATGQARSLFPSALLRVLACVAGLGLASSQATAGDLLRHATTATTPNGTSTAASPGAAASPVNLNAQDILRRSTAALQAVRSMQVAAQAAAAAAAASLGANPNKPTQSLPVVPDAEDTLLIPTATAALTGPGLQVSVDTQGNPVLWQGASLPTNALSNPNKVTVTQSQEQAYLQWQTFDIGKNTTLTFDQSAGGATVGNWIAFNFIRDPSGRPSQILGSLSSIGPANAQGNPTTGGQVYVLDANGIIFGGSAQVNVGALVASSLPINSNLMQRGLLNNPDEQFLFSALAIPAGKNGPTGAFDPSIGTPGIAPAQTPFLADGSGGTGTTYGDILVQPGATLTAPSTTDNVGGRVALVGPNVVNAGTIQTPDGQAILAAGLQVGWVAHSTSDPTLRGLDVYIGSIGDSDPTLPPPAGVATNADVGSTLSTGGPSAAAGLISAPRGDVTITGAVVNQLGAIDSSTSVSYNGRVDLLASYDSLTSGGNSPYAPFYPQKTGTVTLGADSLTQVLPELDSTDTVAATTLSLPSTVTIQAGSVVFAGGGSNASDSGAILLAPSGNVTVDAGSWHFSIGSADTTSAAVSFINDNGQISMGSGGSDRDGYRARKTLAHRCRRTSSRCSCSGRNWPIRRCSATGRCAGRRFRSIFARTGSTTASLGWARPWPTPRAMSALSRTRSAS